MSSPWISGHRSNQTGLAPGTTKGEAMKTNLDMLLFNSGSVWGYGKVNNSY